MLIRTDKGFANKALDAAVGCSDKRIDCNKNSYCQHMNQSLALATRCLITKILFLSLPDSHQDISRTNFLSMFLHFHSSCHT